MEYTAAVRGIGIGVGTDGHGTPAVVLEARGEVLPIFVSPAQAQSMQFALADESPPRPLTHDLIIDLTEKFEVALARIRVDALSSGTFFGKIDATQRHADGEREFVFDARPSDAIALALRADCPVIVSDEVMDAAGRPLDEFEGLDSGSDERE